MMTPARIQKAIHRQRAMHKAAPTSKVTGNLEMRTSHRIDPELFYNGVVQNGGVNPWSDPSYVRDMERKLPEIKVNATSGRIFVGGRGAGTGMGRNHFGRVTSRIWFDKAGNKHEMRAAT